MPTFRAIPFRPHLRAPALLGLALLGLALLGLGAGIAAAAPGADAPPSDPAQRLAAAAQPWLPVEDPAGWSMAHASADSRATCLRSRAVPIPAADLPRPDQLAGLASCDAQALYDGNGGRPDYVRARECAYLQRPGTAQAARSQGGFAFAGPAILMMVYANGLGVPRNLPLATKFACEAGGAPPEIDGRLEHLRKLADAPAPGRRFDVCDDITSGYMGGLCAARQSDRAEAARDAVIDRIVAGYDVDQRRAFTDLRKAAGAFFDAQASNEVDLGGTARAAFEIQQEDDDWDSFVAHLRQLEADGIPAANAAQARHADAVLNDTYRRVLANPELRFTAPGSAFTGMGTINANGIRQAQRRWLAYRDAWLRFAAVRRPDVERSAVLAWLSGQRSRALRAFLPRHAGGGR